MALSQKEVRAPAEKGCPLAGRSWHAGVYVLRLRASSVQADIQMMLAAQCHLGTKCVPRRRPCGALLEGLGFPPSDQHLNTPAARRVPSRPQRATVAN